MTDCGVIVLAVHRPNPTLLQRQLRSIMHQTLRRWKCIVGLDGPDEAAAALLHQEVGHDPRFEIVHFERNVGIYSHFERLLKHVQPGAAWFALADQDDFWHRTKLERLTSALDELNVSGVACQARLTSATGVELGRTARRERSLIPLLLLNEVTGCLSIFRPDVLSLGLPFPPSSDLAIHDHWLGVCAVSLNGFHQANATLQDYVQHEANAIGENRPLPLKIGDLFLGRLPWTHITAEPWQWRVTMARTLRSRAPLTHAHALETISNGELTFSLLRLLAQVTWERRIPAHVAIAFTYAAGRRGIHGGRRDAP